MILELLSLYLNLVQPDIPFQITEKSYFEDSSLLTVSPIPQKNSDQITPILNAKSAYSIDLNSGTEIFSQNSNEKVAIASITKLMTTLVILEEHSLDEVVTIPSKISQVEGSKINLLSGDQLRIKDLLRSMLIHSANDAAVALAEINSGSEQEFVKKMNKKAKKLGMKNTKFTNASGLDTEEESYSTAYDVSVLAKAAYAKPFIKNTVKLKEFQINSQSSENTYSLKTTNKLLDSYLQVFGLKTGTTDKAGQCLVTIAKTNSDNYIMTVILGSSDRYKDTKVLIDWLTRTYQW